MHPTDGIVACFYSCLYMLLCPVKHMQYVGIFWAEACVQLIRWARRQWPGYADLIRTWNKVSVLWHWNMFIVENCKLKGFPGKIWFRITCSSFYKVPGHAFQYSQPDYIFSVVVIFWHYLHNFVSPWFLFTYIWQSMTMFGFCRKNKYI